MKVEDGMSAQVLSIGPGSHAAGGGPDRSAARRVGAAVVVDPRRRRGRRSLTERDILRSVAVGENPDTEMPASTARRTSISAARNWTMEAAAAAMVRGGFRHLVVVEGQDVVGLLSMRDIIRCWSAVRVPAQAGAGTPPRLTSVFPPYLRSGVLLLAGPPVPRGTGAMAAVIDPAWRHDDTSAANGA